jgi:hypothetical protein
MIELVYISRATSLFQPSAIGDILAKSRANNQRQGVTGMLVYRHPYFMQVLEGDEEQVAQLVERIATDPRHTEVTTVHMQSVRRPSFADWTMGYWEANPREVPEIVKQYEGFGDFFAADFEPRLFAANPSKAKRLLLSFRDECLRPRTLSHAT